MAHRRDTHIPRRWATLIACRNWGVDRHAGRAGRAHFLRPDAPLVTITRTSSRTAYDDSPRYLSAIVPGTVEDVDNRSSTGPCRPVPSIPTLVWPAGTRQYNAPSLFAFSTFESRPEGELPGGGKCLTRGPPQRPANRVLFPREVGLLKLRTVRLQRFPAQCACSPALVGEPHKRKARQLAPSEVKTGFMVSSSRFPFAALGRCYFRLPACAACRIRFGGS